MFNQKSKRIKELELKLLQKEKELKLLLDDLAEAQKLLRKEDADKVAEYNELLKQLQSDTRGDATKCTTLILRVGDSRTGWIPSIDHRIDLIKQCLALKLHHQHNIVIFNHAIDAVKVYK